MAQKEYSMKPLLKNLMGNGGKDQETLEAMRAVLAEIQRERARLEAIVEGAQAGAERLKKLGEPLAKTEGDVESLTHRLAQMEERFQGMVKLAELFQNLDERAEGLTKSTQWAESEIAAGIRHAYLVEGEVVEGAGAVGIAAVLAGKVRPDGATAIVVSGANIDEALHRRVVAETHQG